MGKNNKMVNTALWAQRNPGKANDMEERFGVNVRNGAGYKSDSGETYEEYRESSDWHSKMTNAARNDYDLRRTLEAAAMSGKGKAKKILDKGFNNLEDVSKAMNFSEKAAKRHGQGGDFSRNSDYMGLTQSMVERDRRKQEENLVSKDFLDQKLKDLKTTTKSDASPKPVEYTDSEEYAAAKQRLSDGTYDLKVLNTGGPTNPTTAFRDANESAPAADDRAKATNSYLEQYKEDMIKGARIGEARSSNLSNAYNTVIGSDI